MTSSASLNPLELTRLGWEVARPVELDYVMGKDKVGNPDRPLPAEGASFLELDQPDVMLTDWKLAEDGHGTILRLQETADRAVTATLRFARTSIKSATLCNGVEDDLEPVKVEGNSVGLTFRPDDVLTVQVL